MRSRLILFLLSATCLALLVLFPYRNSLVRLVLLALWVLTGLSLLALVWKKKVWRIFVILIAALFVAFLFLPGRDTNTERLRQRFVRQLERYDGVRYVYGGENNRGIDCSGLVRAAMVRSLADESVLSANPALLRSALTLWWHDTNAIQLGKGANGLTLPKGDGAALPMRAARNLQPGDLAVTTTGSHVLAYLGDSRWIEADPDIMRVHIVDLNTSPIAGQEVLLVAWLWLR
jgi:NlpC/P60 family